ncbi:MAG: FAD-binding oxidoreductase [Nocardioidaceae bacterium]
MSDVVGWDAHVEAVARLRASYDAIPVGAPVRLAKRTTNLFRARDATAVPGLDVTGLAGVVALDPGGLTADVQGMCTYEHLVEVTLGRGLAPLVVPQLRSITLGGAVTGLGIESTSFRNGLPHESVLEMDVLTGAGEVVTTRPGEDLFDAFPNSYGSLGYAIRLRIRLERAPAYVDLRHVRFDDLDLLAKTLETIVERGEHDGVRVDGLDGVVFEPGEAYLTLATWRDAPEPVPAVATSDYTGQQIYFRSVRERETDTVTMHDYLWRWDTDWFWCSGAFGLHDPRVRRLWPRRWRRSDVYSRIVGLESRFRLVARLDRVRGRPPRERVIQDIEVPVGRTATFLRWFDEAVGMRPVWLCPLRARREWPSYPLAAHTTYVNVGFWGTVPIAPGACDGDLNRAIEARVTALGGHKSLYSDAYYDRDTFDRLYGVANQQRVKAVTDPGHRLTGLYEKAVDAR